ncbi:Hypothetical protein SMAX5B_008962, partial [Scophthalmus maximus]
MRRVDRAVKTGVVFQRGEHGASDIQIQLPASLLDFHKKHLGLSLSRLWFGAKLSRFEVRAKRTDPPAPGQAEVEGRPCSS